MASKNNMNILQITLGFYPATAWGGPVKVVYENGKELIRRGHKVTVYCTNLFDKKQYIKPYTFEREVDGIRVVYFHAWRIPFWPGTLGPIWLPDLPRVLEREISSFDVIHINGYRNLINLVVSSIARKNNVPFVIQPHGAMPVIINSHLLKRLYDRLLGKMELKDLSALIALQESECQQANCHGIVEKLIEIIPNGLSNQPQVSQKGGFRDKYQIPSTSPLILFLGRINKKKGTDMLIEAFAKIIDLNPYLAIVGPDDGQLEEVKALIEKFNLNERVRLTGLLSGNDIASAYEGSDLFVLPCRTDTFPTTIMEACYYNLPMVVTEGCENAGIIKGRIADIVPFDVQAFADGMRRLIVDRSRYIEYQSNCPKLMAEEFSIESTVDRLERLYTRVLRNSNSL